MSELLNLAIKAAISAGGEIMKFYSSNSQALKVCLKDDSSPLTSADLAANEVILKELSKSGIKICSEESILQESDKDEFWLVDPLDGTKEFLARNGEFCVCIALIKEARPVLGVIFIPVSKELFYADENGAFKEILGANDEVIEKQDLNEKAKSLNNFIFSSRRGETKRATLIRDSLNLEQKCIGSAIKFCRLAELGGIYVRFSPSYLWDNAAGEAVVKFSGGKVLNASDRCEPSYKLADLKSPFYVAFGKNALGLEDEVFKLIEQGR